MHSRQQRTAGEKVSRQEMSLGMTQKEEAAGEKLPLGNLQALEQKGLLSSGSRSAIQRFYAVEGGREDGHALISYKGGSVQLYIMWRKDSETGGKRQPGGQLGGGMEARSHLSPGTHY